MLHFAVDVPDPSFTGITYRQLLTELKNLDNEQLDSTVTVFINDEYYPAAFYINNIQDVLDYGHPVFLGLSYGSE